MFECTIGAGSVLIRNPDFAAKRTTRATASLALAAEKEMKEMKDILAKLGTGTATRDEKAKVQILNSKMNRMKKELEASVVRGPDLELESLRKESKRKGKDLVRSFKDKQV